MSPPNTQTALRGVFWKAMILIGVGFCVAGCSQPDPEASARQALDRSLARLASCTPAPGPAGPVKLAIQSIQVSPQSTLIRLVAYTTDESANFTLPAYTLSRGRWLIGESGRAYLLDQDCREYKLNDLILPRSLPAPGQIQLTRGQAFEMTLKFPPPNPRARFGVLVYANQILPATFPGAGQ